MQDSQKDQGSELDQIIIRGAREHNLKNVDVDLPKNKLIVVTGVSGSGKSSLAFDTIFAEGQRRYIESLSSYARQFIGQLEKPHFETIRGLSPTISIEQKSASRNPRSTVGTITEIYDYLRVLFARIGQQYCHQCGKIVGSGDSGSMVSQIMEYPENTPILILSPMIDHRKGEHRELLENLEREGFVRVRVDGVVQKIKEVGPLARHKKHKIDVVVDRLKIKKDDIFRNRLTDSVETALKLGNGQLCLHIEDREDLIMNEERTCCGIAFPELVPNLFSFNSPKGMCPECNGLGIAIAMDVNKVVPDPSLSIKGGAVLPWKNYFDSNNRYAKDNSWGTIQLKAVQEQKGVDFDTPWEKLPKDHKDLILYGSQGEEMTMNWQSEKMQGQITREFEGILVTMMRRYLQTTSEGQKKWYGQFMSEKSCEACGGLRLRTEILHVKIGEKSIIDVSALSIKETYDFFQSLNLTGNHLLIAEELLKEILNRLQFLINVGLNYLSLDRKGPTLSGGESQRIRLASQIGSELTGVLYVLDEPSIGLHQRDNQKLLRSLCYLRDIGNTLIVVEHDQETIETADWILDIGPGAGLLGGEIVAAGSLMEIKNNPSSLTGRYLSGLEKIQMPEFRRSPKSVGNHWITIKKANENNLKNITAKIPLKLFTAITGVSGAGKSTLINQILFPALSVKLHNSRQQVGDHAGITGLSKLDKVINIDQKAIGRTPKSNPATYTKVFDLIRDLFATMPEAKARGYKKGRFSFNVKGGRCEQCKGDGYIKVEMHFLADVFVPCETCQTKRFNSATLEVLFKGHSIDDVLNMSVRQALELFENQPKIKSILATLDAVGLSYIKLGQPATTLSGGEAQRIKLARELAKKETGNTLYILDEPTTGLHFDDIQKLLKVLQDLTDQGNTIVVIEHNLDVIKNADWVIDLGPEGGKDGGEIIAEGTPEHIASVKHSFTGQYLVEFLSKK